MSLAFHLFNSSVCSTEHLLKSIVGCETFELDSHFDCVSSNKLSYCQQLGVNFDEEFGQLLPLFDSKQQRAISRAKDGNISAWLSVLPLARSQFDLLAQVIESHYYFYLLYAMGVEHHLVLSMLLIVFLGAWLLVGIMRFVMLLVTLLLWFGHLLLRNQLCVMDLLVPIL